MGTMIDNKVSDLIIPSVESTVQLHAAIINTVNSNSNDFNNENINVDETNSNFEKSDTFLRTSITFESVKSSDSSSSLPPNAVKTNKQIEKRIVRTYKSKSRFDDFEINDDDQSVNSSLKMNGLIDSESDDDNFDKKLFNSCTVRDLKKKPSIFDSDDSASEETNDNKFKEETFSRRKSKKLKKNAFNDESISQQMTPKEAQTQRQEITSESQRKVRESRLSLPYHKPKQRTIKEFMSCRPKIADPLSKDLKKLPAINAIKIISNQPEELTKKLEEREKIVENFYKSSSESENEQDENSDIEKSLNENSVALERVILIDSSNCFERFDAVDLEIPRDPLQLTPFETNQFEDPVDDTTNEPSQTDNDDSNENSFTIHKILEEMNLDYSKFKNELIKSFLQPSRLVERLDTEIKSFEDQEDTELISQSDLNKIIDTLNTEDSGKNSESSGGSSSTDILSNKSTQPSQELPKLTDSQMSQLVSKYKSYSESDFCPSWQKGKNFEGLSDSDNDDLKNSLIKNNIKDFKPCLSGTPNQIIDLDENVNKSKDGVDHLLQRFIQHTTKKGSPATKVVEVSVVTTDRGNVKEEKIELTVDKAKNNDSPLFEKPGAKLMRLREDLQKQIARHREEKWIKKQKETKELLGICNNDQDEDDDEEIYKGEKDTCSLDLNNNADDGTEGDDEGGDDDEMEIDEIDDDDEEEDDDDEKEMKIKSSKRLPKSAYIDSEAEESDIDESEDGENDSNVDIDENLNEKTNDRKILKRKKVLRRIKKNCLDDSDSDDNSLKGTQRDKFEDQIEDGSDVEDIPLCQPTEITPEANQKKLKTQPDNSFLSSVQLSALQSIPLDIKIVQDSPKSTFTITQEPSPLKGTSYSPKQLYFDSQPINTQDNLNELMELCSGKFEDSTQQLLSYSQDSEFNLSPASQWLSQDLKQLKNNNNESVGDKNPLEDNNCETLRLFASENESDDGLKQVEKEKNKTSHKKSCLVIVNSSDDDDDDVDKQKKMCRKTKKKRKKLEYSDDENFVDFSNESENSQNEDEEESMTNDECESGDEKIIDYDSEENEILVDKSEISRPVDFIDVEAELSEDEHVGSADENEENLDEMEEEEGDADNIDHRKVKRQLEKIHMQQILDQDKRDVRILQEILLEDGDLHSEKGRQKLFRWKNVSDGLGNDENVQPTENDVNGDEIEEAEDEEKWRRMRHERETFLREQRIKKLDDTSDIIDLENDDSPLLKLRTSFGAVPPIKTSFSSGQNSLNKQVLNDETLELKKPLGLVNKKGSFLSRGERALARLAAKTKPVDEIVIGGAKSSGNFVFQSVGSSPLTTTTSTNIDNENLTAKNSTIKTSTNHVSTFNNNSNMNMNNISNSGKRKNPDSDNTPLIFKKLRAADTLERRVSSRVKKLLDKL